MPDEAHYCPNCGYDFFQDENFEPEVSSTETNSNGKIILAAIAIVVILAAGIMIGMGMGGNTQQADDAPEHVVDLTITEVLGYTGSSSYTLYTEAIFNKVPSDLKGYNVKTTYIDKNGTEIGYETETLKNVYYDTDYALSFGHYTSYKKPDPGSVKIEIIKDGKTVDTFTNNIDQSKIKFLN